MPDGPVLLEILEDLYAVRLHLAGDGAILVCLA